VRGERRRGGGNSSDGGAAKPPAAEFSTFQYWRPTTAFTFALDE